MATKFVIITAFIIENKITNFITIIAVHFIAIMETKLTNILNLEIVFIKFIMAIIIVIMAEAEITAIVSIMDFKSNIIKTNLNYFIEVDIIIMAIIS